MNPLAGCRVRGCSNPTVYEQYGVRYDRNGKAVYGCECARHELERWQTVSAEASFREVQLRYLIGEA